MLDLRVVGGFVSCVCGFCLRVLWLFGDCVCLLWFLFVICCLWLSMFGVDCWFWVVLCIWFGILW